MLSSFSVRFGYKPAVMLCFFIPIWASHRSPVLKHVIKAPSAWALRPISSNLQHVNCCLQYAISFSWHLSQINYNLKTQQVPTMHSQGGNLYKFIPHHLNGMSAFTKYILSDLEYVFTSFLLHTAKHRPLTAISIALVSKEFFKREIWKSWIVIDVLNRDWGGYI